MDKYRSLPFATYDLAVYIPGGAVCLLLLKYLIGRFAPNYIDVSIVPHDADLVDQVLRGVVWLSLSYLLGHIASFISSYLVEKFVHYSLGYPSSVWLRMEELAAKGSDPTSDEMKALFKANTRHYPTDSFAAWVILLAQGPALLLFAAMLRLRVYGYYTPKLPHGLVEPLRLKLMSLGISVPVEIGTRWEKLVEHYVANNCPTAYVRMYNYLVIYGAMRILSFLLLGVIWWLTVSNFIRQTQGFSFDIRYFIMYWNFVISYVVAAMAFAKFNRRYFEECVLAFLMSRSSVHRQEQA